MADDEATISDSDIALMMATGDQGGLRLLIDRYGGRIKAFLFKRFRSVLQEGELAEALNVTFYNIWRFADRYEEGKGTLASWCIRIAQRAAQSILRRETKYRAKNLEYDATYDPAGDPHEDGMVADELGDDPKLDVLPQAIEMLPPLQKAIVKADLAANGVADARRLAEIHGTTINSIYVSRTKAHENLKRQVEQLSRQPAGKRR
jgi:DNA-directed RNA polymerase specialized sigma24 family protein